MQHSAKYRSSMSPRIMGNSEGYCAKWTYVLRYALNILPCEILMQYVQGWVHMYLIDACRTAILSNGIHYL